jgi:hypothetical protein
MTYAEYDITKGMRLMDEEGREFRVDAVTTRIAVIANMAGAYVESVSHMFVRCKYKPYVAPRVKRRVLGSVAA